MRAPMTSGLHGSGGGRDYALKEAHLYFLQVVELIETAPNCADDTFPSASRGVATGLARHQRPRLVRVQPSMPHC
jgi:hypothetical protein